jgi:hypothetical protein
MLGVLMWLTPSYRHIDTEVKQEKRAHFTLFQLFSSSAIACLGC